MADDEAGMKNTREDRIRQRRQRIEQRQSSRNVGGSRKNRGDGMGAGNDTLSLGKQQTQTSLAHIDRVKARSIEHVTTVRVEADNIENRRRIVEEDKRHERLRRLQEEAIKSGKQNAAVEMRWQELMNYNMPNDLRDELAKQTDMCKNIKDSKQGLIEEFKQELKSKDEDYVLALKKQGEDITQLISRMRKQYKDLQGEYHAELNQIEDAFMRERDELLLNNKNEIDGLFDKRRQMEIHYMEAKQDREEKFAEEIDALRVRDAEDYSKLKIKLETDIQTLEQQLEEMRATYQLNTEKLEYNYRVLTERDMENSATLSTQKRRLARLKEALANLVQKYTQSDTKHKQLNQELTDEYRRITKQYKDLQNKFRHFEVADNDKFQQVWEMHTDEASKLVEKVLQADEIIHTQLLGMRWLPPSGDVFAQNKARQEAAATTAAADGGDGDGAQKTEKEASSQRVDQAKVKIMLRLLCDEAGFLIDQATHDKIKSMGTKEGLVTKADSILDALGIESEDDVERLLRYFFDVTTIDENFSDDEDADLTKELKVKSGEVVAAVRKFVADREEDRRDDPAMQVQAAAVAEKAAAAQRSRRRKEDRLYWRRISNVVPPKTIRVWKALGDASDKYDAIIKQRAAAVDEVAALNQQNAELKRLLNQYLGSDVNDELHIPPTQVIRVNP